MKRFFCALLLVALFVGCSSEKNDLYNKVDYFIASLDTDYISYGLEGAKHKKYTKNGYYQIYPIGRLINIRIEKPATREEYEQLKSALSKRYKNDKRVNEVYICNGGTIMVDCRDIPGIEAE